MFYSRSQPEKLYIYIYIYVCVCGCVCVCVCVLEGVTPLPNNRICSLRVDHFFSGAL